ncbi:unnamed protein product [Protopolystoma xenopodis]|uniref:Uncharacterized protein n=1 Tax=Protopolystoma xenopodis TaxID=117903 RepID=A0A3S5ASG0_9PLAT|nr:unnamed protein product [Protopolystoma xenopodis]
MGHQSEVDNHFYFRFLPVDSQDLRLHNYPISLPSYSSCHLSQFAGSNLPRGRQVVMPLLGSLQATLSQRKGHLFLQRLNCKSPPPLHIFKQHHSVIPFHST